MSTEDVITVIVPSVSTRHTAAAGSFPPGQKPMAKPTPSSGGSEWRFSQSSWPRSSSSTSRVPISANGRPVTAMSPSTAAFLERSSIGSTASFSASSSRSDSTAKAAVGAPGAR